MKKIRLSILIFGLLGAPLSALAFFWPQPDSQPAPRLTLRPRAAAPRVAAAEPRAGSSPALVRVAVPAKVKRGTTFTAEVEVDLGGATGPAGEEAALGSYVVPIAFDPTLLAFVSAGPGESPAFAAGPTSATNAAAAAASGVVALAGVMSAPAAVGGVQGVASVTFRVVATRKSRSEIGIGPELAAPGLSLSSPSEPGSAPYRIAAVGQSSPLRIK